MIKNTNEVWCFLPRLHCGQHLIYMASEYPNCVTKPHIQRVRLRRKDKIASNSTLQILQPMTGR